MTEQVEDQLRAVLRGEADQAPQVGALGEQVVRRVRRQRTARIAAFAAALVLAGSGAAVLGSRGFPGDDARRGPVPDSVLADCLTPDSVQDIAAKATFGFDGTVEKIEPFRTGTTERLATVTFAVEEWFRAGTGDRTVVLMAAPVPDGTLHSEAGPNYAVGTRLLVSGDLRSGAAPFAWGCGHTRYHDEGTASSWRAAFRSS